MSHYLNRREKYFLFAREYVKDFNIKRAAIEAGYTPEHASKQGNRLLALDDVKEYINFLVTMAESKTIKTLEDIIAEYEFIAFANIDDYYNDWISPKDFEDIPSQLKKVIKSVVVAEKGLKIEFHDKMQALKQLEQCKRLDETNRPLEINIDFSAAPTIDEVEGFNEEDLDEKLGGYTYDDF